MRVNGLVLAIAFGSMAVAVAMAHPARADAPIFKCPAQPPPKPQTEVWKWPLLSDVSPFQRWSCLDGEVVGVLVAYDGGLRNVLWGHTLTKIGERGSGGGSYVFTTGDDSPRALYFAPPAPKQSALKLGVSDGSGKPYVELSSMLTPAAGRDRKLGKDAHLVRLQVNGGRGSSGGVHFIATRVEVLDGTRPFPLDVSRALHDTLEPLESTTSPQGKRWRGLLRAAIADAAKQDPGFGALAAVKPVEVVRAGFRVTWLADRRVLRIVFYSRMAHVLRRETRNPHPRAGTAWCDAPPGADCAPRMIPTQILTGRVYAAEYARVVEISHDGKRLSDKEHPVRVKPATGLRWGTVDPDLLHEAGISMDAALGAAP